jgi:hypothetical protein
MTAHSCSAPATHPESTGVRPARADRVRRLAIIILALGPPIVCAWLAQHSGRWELFERSGSITTAVGLAVASRRYIRYGALELTLLETGKRERDTVDILTEMATGKLGLALSAFGTVVWGWGEYLRWWSFSYVVVWALFALRDARRDASPEHGARRPTSDPQSP